MKDKNEAILKLFKAYLIKEREEIKIGSYHVGALKKGICIYAHCDQEIVDLAISLFGKDGTLFNQTFHKSFKTVLKKRQEELILQQLMHYFTTYGFLENEEYVYIPKEKLKIPELKDSIQLILIQPIHESELKERLLNLCYRSLSLSEETIQSILILSDFINLSEEQLTKVKNRELKLSFYEKLGIIPKEPDTFIKYLIFSLTGNPLIIKDKKTFQELKSCDKEKALDLLMAYQNQYDIKRLAEIFNRYKPLFLSLKTESGQNKELLLNAFINKISHLSKKYHRPMIQNDFNFFLKWYLIHEKEPNFEELLLNQLKKSGIWVAIRLNNYLKYKKLKASEKVYKIRNGKVWITEKEEKCSFIDERLLEILDTFIVKQMKECVNEKKIYMDEFCELALPQSEKQFIGTIPFGSSLSLDKENLIVGIHWYNTLAERVDLDLKIISNEYTIGWDAHYSEEDQLIFSGDVTDAPLPLGATECIYIDSSIGKMVFSLKINNYTMNSEPVYYDLIIARGHKKQLKKNYVIDSNDVLLKIPNNEITKDQSECSIGTIVIEDTIQFIFTNLSTSNRICSENDSLEDVLRRYLVKENTCQCKLEPYLKKAGAIIVKNRDECWDIDLGIEQLKKDSILQLFCQQKD